MFAYSKRALGILFFSVVIALPGVSLADEEKPGLKNPKGPVSLVKKLATQYLSARKQLVCTQCEGQFRIKCTTCKGKAWKFKSNRYKRGGVDWDSSVACPKCNVGGQRPSNAYARREKKRGTEPRNAPGAGEIDCPKTFCTFGFNRKAAKKIFWDLRSPTFQSDMTERLRGLNTDGFVELVCLFINDKLKGKRAVKAKEIAGRTGVNPEAIAKLIRDSIDLKKNWVRLANGGKLADYDEAGAELELRHFKSKDRFTESMTVYWLDSKAFLSAPKREAPKAAEGEEKAGEAEGGEKSGEGEAKPKGKKTKGGKKKKKKKKKRKGNKKKGPATPEPKPEKKKEAEPDTGNSP
jgi:hypothetical protein